MRNANSKGSLKLATENSIHTDKSKKKNAQKLKEDSIFDDTNLQRELDGEFVPNPRVTPNIKISEGIPSIMRKTPEPSEYESEKSLFGLGMAHLNKQANQAEKETKKKLIENWQQIKTDEDMAKLMTNQYNIEYDKRKRDYIHIKLDERYEEHPEVQQNAVIDQVELKLPQTQPSELSVQQKSKSVEKSMSVGKGQTSKLEGAQPKPVENAPPMSKSEAARHRADRKYYLKIFSNYKEHRLQYYLKEYKEVQEAIREKCRVLCSNQSIDRHFEQLKIQAMERAVSIDLKRRFDLQLRLIRLKMKGEADQEDYANASRSHDGLRLSTEGDVSPMGSEEFKTFNLEQHLKIGHEMQIDANQIKRYRLLKKILLETRKLIDGDTPDRELNELINRQHGILANEHLGSENIKMVKYKTFKHPGESKRNVGMSQSPQKQPSLLDISPVKPKAEGKQGSAHGKRETANSYISSLSDHTADNKLVTHESTVQDKKLTKEQKFQMLREKVRLINLEERKQLELEADPKRCQQCGQYKGEFHHDQSDQSVNDMFHQQVDENEGNNGSQEEGTKNKQALKAFGSIRGQMKENKERFEYIKIPLDFRTQFEIDRKMQPGTSLYASRELNDEIRILFLLRQNEFVKEKCEERIKEYEIKMKRKIHSYGHACVKIIEQELQEQFKQIFVQLDHLRHEQVKNLKLIEEQRQTIVSQQAQVSQIRAYAKWDEIAHEDFTLKLQAEGLKVVDLYNSMNPAALDQECHEKRIEGLADYYKKLFKLSDVEKDNLLLTEPFALYNTQMRIGVFEKLNVLERETVQYYRRKLEEYELQEQDVTQYQDEKEDTPKKVTEEQPLVLEPIEEEDLKIVDTSQQPVKRQSKEKRVKVSKNSNIIKQLQSDLKQKDIQMHQITEMLQKEKERLHQRIHDLEEEIKFIISRNDAALSNKQREFDQMKLQLNKKITNMEEKAEEQERLHTQELNLKDLIIAKLNSKVAEQLHEIDRLMVILRIPRFHHMHLLKNGKLEEFVDAKILGKDARAKWLLMTNAEVELDNILSEKRRMERQQRKEKLLSQSLENKSYSLSSDECVRKSICAANEIMPIMHSVDSPNEKRFIIHSSINDKKQKKMQGVHEYRHVPGTGSQNTSSRNFPPEDTLCQNSSCEPGMMSKQAPTSVNSPNNVQQFNMEQFSINSIISQSNQNSQTKIKPHGMGSSKQSTNIGSINQTVQNAFNTTRDNNHIQVQNQQDVPFQKRLFDKTNRRPRNLPKEAHFSTSKQHKREPLTLSVSNAEEILDPETYNREMLSYRGSLNYQNVKMAHILNSSIHSGAVKFKRAMPKTTKNLNQTDGAIDQVQRSVQLPQLRQSVKDQALAHSKKGSPSAKHQSANFHGVRTLKISNRPITQPKAQGSFMRPNTINNGLKEARLGMVRFSLVNPQTQSKFHNDSQFCMSDVNQLDDSQIQREADQSHQANSLFDRKINNPRERISQFSPETRGITSIDKHSHDQTATCHNVAQDVGNLSSAFSPTNQGSAVNLMSTKKQMPADAQNHLDSHVASMTGIQLYRSNHEFSETKDQMNIQEKSRLSQHMRGPSDKTVGTQTPGKKGSKRSQERQQVLYKIKDNNTILEQGNDSYLDQYD